MLWIRIRSDPKLFAKSRFGVGSDSGINHFESRAGQPLLGMTLKQNFSDKIHNFSTKCTIKINKNLLSLKSLSYKNISLVTAQLSRGGDQRCRIRSRIRNKSFRIHNPGRLCTDKKENKIFLIYKEIQKGVVAKSYMTNGLLIFD